MRLTAFVYLCVVVSALDKSETYGPYKLTFGSLTKVAGAKKVDCTQYEVSLDHKTNEMSLIINVTKNIPVVQSRIMVYIIKQSSKKLLVQYNLKNPCEHFLMAQYYVTYFNTTKSCIIHKGIYRIKMPINDILEKFFGANFFYGEYLMKGYTSSNNCDLMCMESTVTFIKKI